MFEKTTLRQRIHEWLEGEREIRGYYSGPHGEQRKREDAQYEHYMLVTQYELENPHVTRVGIELVIFLNTILFNVEAVLYVLTGRMSKRWKLELQRAQMEEYDALLLSYAN